VHRVGIYVMQYVCLFLFHTRHVLEESTYVFKIRWIWYMYEFLQKYLLDPKDRLLGDALASLHRNPVCNIVPNLIESSLMGKIQDQSVSTYLGTRQSVCTHTNNCYLASHAF
jgi:hypothetical protein